MSLVDLLTRRHGEPHRGHDDETNLETLRFRAEDDPRRAVLHLASGASAPGELRELYGPIHGGFLAGDMLKLATLDEPEVYGLYSLAEYATLDDLEPFTAGVPGVTVFMDAANVYYLGVHGGRLWQYDVETGEVLDRGDLTEGLTAVLDEWENA
jgi:hypothetical protein